MPELRYNADGPVALLMRSPGFSPASGFSLAYGPGCPPREGAARLLLFEAGAAIRKLDLIADFWREEAPGLDWWRDFQRGSTVDALLTQLAQPPAEEEDEAEILYSRSQLTTLGSEVVEQ